MIIDAGATAEEETGETKVKADTESAAAHFVLRGQLNGIERDYEYMRG